MIIFFFVLLFLASPSWATIYYVSTTGNDSNTCVQARSISTPKKTISQGVGCLSAGDTLYVRAGTYSGQSITDPPSGTAVGLTIISGYPSERPIITGAGIAGINFSGTFDRSYVEITGFEFSSTQLCMRLFTASATGTHHISYINNICHDTEQHGILTDAQVTDNIYTDNTFYRIGVGSAGYVPGRQAFYGAGSRTIIARNVLHDMPHGINVYSSVGGRSQDNVQIYDNLLYNIARDDLAGNEWMAGQALGLAIRQASPGNGIKIYNNVIYNSKSTAIALDVSYSGTSARIFNNTVYNMVDNSSCINIAKGTGAIVQNNICYVTGGVIITAGTGSQSNTLTTNPSFVDAASGNFTLSSGSAAIGAGTNSIPADRPCNGTCDIGAYETFGFSSANVTSSTMEVTLGMNLNTPVVPTSSGWTIACTPNPTACPTPTITSVTLNSGSSSMVEIQFSGGACSANQTWTVSYTATTGATTDSSRLPFQQELSSFTAQPVTNNCGGASFPWTGTLSITAMRAYGAKTNVSGSLVPMADNNTNISVAPGGAIAIAMQTDCTSADCTAISERLYYACSSCPSAGTDTAMPGTAGTDKIGFWGISSETGLLSGAHGANLTGALPHVNGTTNLTSDSIPVFDLAQNNSTVMRWIVRIEQDATIGWVYCLKAREQSGVQLNAMTPSSGLCVTVKTPSSSAGY